MKKRICYIIFLCLALTQFNCVKKGSEKGKMVKVERTAGSISQILVYDNVNLVLTQDTVERIQVEAPEDIEPYIMTNIEGHSLSIKNSHASLLLPPGQKINVYVSVKSLGRLDYLGAGNVTCTNTLVRDYFTVESSDGSGNLNLKLNTILTTAYLYSDVADFIFEGSSDSCYSYCSSMGTIDYSNFRVKKLEMDYSSIRDAHVWAEEQFKGRIFFRGNVYYKGNPTYTQLETPGSGKFISY